MKQLLLSLTHAVNAYETAPEGTVTTPLADFCARNGLPGESLAKLDAQPGPTSPGRVQRELDLLASAESAEDAPVLDDDGQVADETEEG